MRRKVTGNNQVAEVKSHLQTSVLRLWSFRIIAMVVIPVLSLVLLEVALRVAGYGYPTAAFLRCEINGQTFYRSNERFGWRFFPPEISGDLPPIVIGAVKSPETYRIFVLGESAARGVPNPPFRFGRQLSVMLRNQYPSVNFHVYTVAMEAINSHALVPIAKDCARLKPDLFVIYMGNNEVVGPYGAGTVFSSLSKNLSLIRFNMTMKATKVGQLLSHLAAITNRSDTRPETWWGLDILLGKQLRHDDEQLQYVYSHFRRNLEGIVQIAQESGAKTIVSTVAVNLKDCPPFASMHKPGLNEQQKQNFDALYQASVNLEETKDFKGAIDNYLAAAEIDNTYAELQFRLGRCQWNLEQFDKAKESYIRAMELDTLRFRADSTINRIIREVGENREADGVYFIDAAEAFAAQSPHNCPGYELFFEHVHPVFSGNYLLAKTVFGQVEQILPDRIKAQKAADAVFPSRDECANQLALTVYDRLRVRQKYLEIISNKQPFINQPYHDEAVVFWGQKTEELKNSIGPNTPAKTLEQYKGAIKLNSNDRLLRTNYAGFLWQTYDNPLEAAAQYQLIIKQWPYDYKALTELARVEAMQGNLDSSLKHALKAVEIMPTNPITNYITGMAYKMKGQLSRAQRYFIKTIKINPTLIPAYVNLGSVLIQQGKTEQAERVYRKGIEVAPDDAYLRLNLALLLRQKGMLEEAKNEMQKAIKLDPSIVALPNPPAQ